MLLRMVQFTEDNGKMNNDGASECKYGQMELSMKVIGEITKLMGRGNFGTQMAMSTMASGKMTKLMAKEFTLM